MCYKQEKQKADGEKLQKIFDEYNVPEFIMIFLVRSPAEQRESIIGLQLEMQYYG